MNYLLTMILIFLFKTSHQDDLSTATSSIPSTTEFISKKIVELIVINLIFKLRIAFKIKRFM